MRITKLLGASVLAAAAPTAQNAGAFTVPTTSAITVTANAAPPAASCVWNAPTAPAFALGNFQKAGDTPGSNKGGAFSGSITCTGAPAVVTVSAISTNLAKLQSGTTNAYSIAYDLWPGATTLPATGTPLTLSATPQAFPTAINTVSGTAAPVNFYVNVKATTPLVAIGTPAVITATTPFTDTVTLSATYN